MNTLADIRANVAYQYDSEKKHLEPIPELIFILAQKKYQIVPNESGDGNQTLKNFKFKTVRFQTNLEGLKAIQMSIEQMIATYELTPAPAPEK